MDLRAIIVDTQNLLNEMLNMCIRKYRHVPTFQMLHFLFSWLCDT